MSDNSNYFAQAYGAAPPPPPPEEQLPPPPQAAPAQAASGNYFQDTYVAPPPQQAAPPPPPENYQPGSTYVPPADRGLTQQPPVEQKAPAQPPPATFGPEKFLKENLPQEAHGFIPSVTEFMEQPTLLDKAGMALGAASMPFDWSRQRQGTKARDAALKGDPDATLGAITPQAIKEHPENVLDVLPTLASNVPGGGEDELYAWAEANPDKAEQFQDDPAALYDAWLADTNKTLETGGLSGAAAGMVRGAGIDPTLPVSLGVNTVATNVSRGLQAAGRVGAARGITMADTGIQTAIDPLGMLAETGIRKAVGLGMSPTAKQQAAEEITQEALRSASLAGRQATQAAPVSAVPQQTPMAAVPPPVAPTPPAGAVVPPTPAPIPTQPVPTNGLVPPPQAPVVAPRPQTPPSRNGSLPPLMRDPRAGWVTTDGQKPTPDVLRRAYQEIENAPTEQLRPFPQGSAVVPNEDTRLSSYLAAMTEQRLVLDDWPSSRTGDPPRQKAGQAWTDLFAARIRKHGQREVQKLVDDFHNDLGRSVAQGPLRSQQSPTYWDDRAQSIIEAARKADYDGTIDLTTPTRTHTHVGSNGSLPTARATLPEGGFVQTGSLDEDWAEAFQQTVQWQRTPTTRERTSSDLLELMSNPDGFGETFKQTRERLYKSRAWSKTMASPITDADSPEVVAKKQAQNAAYQRYQTARDFHEATHGATTPQTQARRGASIVQTYGNLAPREQAIADAVAQEFRAHLDQMGLGHVRLGLVDHIRETGTLRQLDHFAEFDPELHNIDLSVNYTMGNVLFDLEGRFGPNWAQQLGPNDLDGLVRRSLYQSLNHETVHALRTMGVYTPDEWQMLVREANERGYGQWAAHHYDDLNPNAADEEAVAELFGDFALDQLQATPQTRNLLQRIVDFFTGFVRSTATHDADGVMKRMLSGDVGSRRATDSATGPLMAKRWEGGPLYHGSLTPGIERLTPGFPRTDRPDPFPFAETGVFMTPNKTIAASYAGNKGQLYEAIDSLENPLYIDFADFGRMVDEVGDGATLRKNLIDQGYDGVVLRETDFDTGKPVINEVVSLKEINVRTTKARRGQQTGASRSSLLQRSLGIKATATENLPIRTDGVDPLFDALPLPQAHKGILLNEVDYQGSPQTLYAVQKDVQDELEALRVMGRTNASKPLTGPDKHELERLKKAYDAYDPRYDWADPKFSDAELDRIAADHVTDLWAKTKFPDQPRPAGALASVKELNRNVMSFRRIVGLTNWASFPRQAFQQFFGNVIMDAAAKPSALVTMFKPGTYRRIFQQQRGKPTLTSFEEMLVDMGVAPANGMINNQSKALSKHMTKQGSSTLESVRKVIAPDVLGDIVSTPDGVHRSGIAEKTFLPAMKRELTALPRRSGEVAAAFQQKYGDLMLDPRQVERVTGDAIAAHKRRFEPISRINAAQLENAIVDAFKTAPGANQTRVRDFANRIARDFREVQNLQYQQAAKEVKRVAFSWDNTSADELVANAFLYHYWTSRAGLLYAKEAIKKPWLAGSFIRLGEQLVAEAEQNGYPDWMKGFTRLLNSPAGMVLMTSPTDMLGTLLTFADWQYGQDSGALKGDLSQLGALRGMAPLAMNPILDYGAWLFGGYGGEDARLPPNPTGAEPTFKLGADILNLALYNGLLPEGMGRDANGQPVPFGNKPISQLLQQFGEAFFDRPQIDLYAGARVNEQFFLEDVLREEHPDWNEDQLSRERNQIVLDVEMGKPRDEMVEAQRRVVDMSLTGPDFPGLPEQLRPFVGAAVKLISPVRSLAMPETKAIRQYGFGQVDHPTEPVEGDPSKQRAVLPEIAAGDQYDTSNLKNRPFQTLEMAELKAAEEDWWEMGGDSGLSDAVQMFNSIGRGEVPKVKVGDFTYTNGQLILMSKGERYQIAEKYLNAQGFTVADKDQYYEDREAIEAAHPDLAGFLAYKEYVDSYAGGLQAFVDTAVRTSPSFARYMSQLPYPPGSEDYYGAAKWADAYYAIEGRRGGVYDPLTLPERGTVPGLAYGETFAQKKALQEAVEAAGDGSNDYDEFVADIDEKVSNLYYAKKLLDETYPGTGLVPGRDYLPYDMYQTMKEVWEANGVFSPDKGSIELEYYDWLAANATAPDHTVKSFLDQRESNAPGVEGGEMPPPTPQDVAAQLGVELATAQPARLNPAGKIDTTGMQRVYSEYDMPMRTGPGQNNPVNVTVLSGMPLFVTDIQGEWAQVIAPGEQVGWIPTAALLKAA